MSVLNMIDVAVGYLASLLHVWEFLSSNIHSDHGYTVRDCWRFSSVRLDEFRDSFSNYTTIASSPILSKLYHFYNLSLWRLTATIGVVPHR